MRKIYEDIWREGSAAISAGACELDEQIDSRRDARRGITLIFRPAESVLNRFAGFLRQVEGAEPDQYIYTLSQIHTTVLSIITCADGFDRSEIDLAAYEEVIASCAAAVMPFEMRYTGLTASVSCIMAQGFPESDALETLRSRLREAFQSSGLRHTIDARYSIATAHSTLVRFRRPLKDSGAFLDLVKQHRTAEWGRCLVAEPVLVHNDWYHQAGRVTELAKFPLGG